VVPTDRTGGNGYILKHMKFHLNTIIHFFTVEVVKHRNRLPREVVEILKTQQDTDQSNF